MFIYSNGGLEIGKIHSFLNVTPIEYWLFVMSSEQIITNEMVFGIIWDTNGGNVTSHRLKAHEFIYWNSIIWKKRFMCVIKTFIKEVLLSSMVENVTEGVI